ncbi:lytic transglycosylase domain-containing protein, partial [Neoroseomonas oryzicola]
MTGTLRGGARAVMAIALMALLSACAQTGTRSASNGPYYNRPDSTSPPGPPSDPWGPWIRDASRRFDVPELWIREVMRQESGGRANAVSPAGAMGLMQVMPGTYRELQARYNLGPDPYHPYDSIQAGAAYLREMYELYGNPAFLAAYNAGPRRLEEYLWGGRGLPNETRNYVSRIGPRIASAAPNRRAAPEVYAAAEMGFYVPAGPRPVGSGTALALRDQRDTPAPVQVA